MSEKPAEGRRDGRNAESGIESGLREIAESIEDPAVKDRRRVLGALVQSAAGNPVGAAQTLKGEKTLSKELLKTMGETLLFTICERIMHAYAQRLFPNVRLAVNAATKDPEGTLRLIRQDPIGSFLSVGIVMPIIETVIFQAVPSGMVDQWYKEGERVVATEREDGTRTFSIEETKRKLHMKEMLVTSALFAGVHNLLAADFKGIPLMQFIGGCFLWYQQRKRGTENAVFAHMLINNLSLGILQSDETMRVYGELMKKLP